MVIDGKTLGDAARASALGGVWSWAIRVPADWRAYRRRQRALRTLLEFEPQRLDDIGVTRQDLEELRRRL